MLLVTLPNETENGKIVERVRNMWRGGCHAINKPKEVNVRTLAIL